MRALILVLVALLLGLQYTLWFGRGGMRDVWRVKEQIAVQREENATLEARNRGLAAEVMDLKQGLDAIEELARTEMGMIRQGETFYQMMEPVAVVTPPPAAK